MTCQPNRGGGESSFRCRPTITKDRDRDRRAGVPGTTSDNDPHSGRIDGGQPGAVDRPGRPSPCPTCSFPSILADGLVGDTHYWWWWLPLLVEGGEEDSITGFDPGLHVLIRSPESTVR